jgi:hypothetical protein
MPVGKHYHMLCGATVCCRTATAMSSPCLVDAVCSRKWQRTDGLKTGQLPNLVSSGFSHDHVLYMLCAGFGT